MMPPKQPVKTTATRKPIPAGVRPSTGAKKPAPTAVKPSTKKPAPRTTPTTVSKAPVASKNPSSIKPVSKPAPRPTPNRTATQAKKAAPAAAAEPPASGANWINRTAQGYVAGVGNYAGGWVNSIGASVNKVGEGIGGQITDRTRGWGQGVAGYGNNLKDAVGVGGPRVSTAGNPLGMAGKGSAGAVSKNAPARSGGKASASNPLGV